MIGILGAARQSLLSRRLLMRGTQRTFLTASSNDDLISARLALLILTLGNGSVASSPCPFELVSTMIPLFSDPEAEVDALLRAIIPLYPV